MTAPRIKSLNSRQAEKATLRSLELMDERNVKLNSRLVGSLLLNSLDVKVIVFIKNYFFRRVHNGKDKKALDFLIKHSSEKTNPNALSRINILLLLAELAQEGKIKETLPGLLIGVTDSNMFVRKNAMFGLCHLAELGVKEVLPELFKGLDCDDITTRKLAAKGVEYLAEKGDREAQEGLRLIKNGHVWMINLKRKKGV